LNSEDVIADTTTVPDAITFTGDTPSVHSISAFVKAAAIASPVPPPLNWKPLEPESNSTLVSVGESQVSATKTASLSLRKRLIVFAGAAVVIVAGALGIVVLTGSSSSARTVAAQALTDIKAGRWLQLCNLAEPSQQASCQSSFGQTNPLNIALPNAKIASVVTNGDQATATFSCSGAAYCRYLTGSNSVLPLVLLNGKWYINGESGSSVASGKSGSGNATTTFATTTTTFEATTTTFESSDEEASALTSLLNSSTQDRAELQSSIGTVQAVVGAGAGCNTGVSTAASALLQIQNNRQALLQQLSTLSMSKVPQGPLVLEELGSAWRISERIDADFEAWASTEVSRNCSLSDSDVSTYVATESLDPKSTSLKTTFVELWDPIAQQLGQPSTWTAGQI